MLVRNAARATCLLALALVFNAAAAAAPSRDRTPPSTPTNLRITASGPNSISLAWNKSTDNSTNWWYCLQRDGLGCIRINPPQTTFSHSKLWPNTTFRYSVVALDTAGNRSASSNTVTYTTPPDTTAPSPPPTLTATKVYPTRIYLAWTASKDNVSQVWYTLYRNGVQEGSNLIGSNGATLLELTPATTYTFKVTAGDAFGNVTESNTLSVTTPPVTDTVPPTVPTNLALSSESSPPEIWLDWDQSTDDTDLQSEILYDVYVNGELDHAAIGYGETITYCRPAGVRNTIVLRAVDTSGNESAPSNDIAFDC